MTRRKIALVFVLVCLCLVSVSATMFGVFIPADDPNSAVMTYGGNIQVSMISSRTTQVIDANDPNVLIITTTIRQRIVDSVGG